MLAQIQYNNDNSAQAEAGGADDDDYSLPSSPPPTYKSRASTVRPPVHITFPPTQGGDYPSSRPPTYRSSHGNSRPEIPQMRGEGVDNPAESNGPSHGPLQSSPGSASSSLHRANRVVEYLEGVIDSADQASSSLPPEGATGSEQGQSEDQNEPWSSSTSGVDTDNERLADLHL